MIINPEKILFETDNDVIDYVTKGVVSSHKNFEKVISKVRFPDDEKIEGEVYISNGVFVNCDNDTMAYALRRVYQNRVRNRNICIGIAGIVIAGLLFGKVSGNKKDKDDIDI